MERNSKLEETKEKKLETCEDWQGFFTSLANPKCTKCYGRGYVGWAETTHGKMPVACNGKNCSIQKLRIAQRQQQLKELKAKQEAKKNDSQ